MLSENIIFTETNSIRPRPCIRLWLNFDMMIRKITLLFLLCVGFHTIGHAVTIRDSVSISLPKFMDTTCPGTQLTFTAIETNDTFSSVSYHWYTNSVFTGVIIDTFKTTALADGDSVYCMLYFTNSAGFPDSQRSNVIYVYHASSIAPALLISITAGSNPDCAGHELWFMAYPKNGGTSPLFQWMVNGVPVAGADTATFAGIFSGTDTISCQLISNSPCSAPYDDTVISNLIPIIHIHLHAGINITDTHNPMCAGTIDSFMATITDPGVGSSIAWYVNSVLVPTAVGNLFVTSSLHNGDLIYAILTTPDSCELSDSVVSNPINATVIPLNNTSVSSVLIKGSNPGCLDSTVTFAGTFSNFGKSPTFDWLVNGAIAATNVDTFTSLFFKGDIVTFRVNATDSGCYTNDTLGSTPYLMLRDSTPAAPLLSLINNQLVNNMDGKYRWYFNTVPAYGGSALQIGGASAKTFHPSSLVGTGYYYTILDTANCPSPESNIIYISLLKVNMLSSATVKIYPNPTSGILNLEWDNRTVNMKVDVYNIIGQPLLHDEIIGQSHHEVNMAALPEGNYMVVLRDDDDGNTSTYKIYLQK